MYEERFLELNYVKFQGLFARWVLVSNSPYFKVSDLFEVNVVGEVSLGIYFMITNVDRKFASYRKSLKIHCFKELMKEWNWGCGYKYHRLCESVCKLKIKWASSFVLIWRTYR